MLKRLVLIFFTLTLFSVSIFGYDDTYTADQQYRVAVNPIWTAQGITRIQGEYRLQPHIAPGLDYFTWSTTLGDSEFSLTGIHPYARWYKEEKVDGWYAGGGYMQIQFAYSDRYSSGSATVAGPTVEGGYQWRWESFHQEVGYEMWMLGAVKTDSGDSIDMGSVAGFSYSLGMYF